MKKFKVIYNSMFSQLMLGFILVIFLIASFYIITNRLFIKTMERQITDNVSKNFDYITQQIDNHFEKNILSILVNFNSENLQKLSDKEFTVYDMPYLSKQKAAYKIISSYFHDMLIYYIDSEKILTLTGIYSKNEFFTKYYNSKIYSEEYLDSLFNNKFTYIIFPPEYFKEYSDWEIDRARVLIPVVYRPYPNSKYVLLALIDFNELKKSIKPQLRNSLYIYNEKNEIIYPQQSDKTYNSVLIDDIDRTSYLKLGNGILFSKKSSITSLKFYSFESLESIKKHIDKTNTIFRITIVISILLCLTISFFIVRKFNNPVENMVNIIKQSSNNTANDEIINLRYISRKVQDIIKENKQYEKDITDKDSILKSISCRARLMNMVLGSNELMSFNHIWESINSSYLLVLFKVHYRKRFFKEITGHKDKGIVVINEIIDSFFNKHGKDITFQVDNDKIVVILDKSKLNNNIDDIVLSFSEKMESEDSFIFFTIIISDIYSEVSNINVVYENLLGLLMYRNITDKSQIIKEKGFIPPTTAVCLSKEQKSRIEDLICTCSNQQAKDLVGSITDYYLKKNLSNMSMYLFLVEFINICKDVLVRVFSCVPDDSTIYDMYSMIRHYEDAEEYKDAFNSLINLCCSYIKKNRGDKEDHIVSFIKEYIEKNYQKEIYTEMIAEKLKLTRSYISKYFKKKTGMNLTDYINKYKIEKAADMLENTPLMVKDISRQIGIVNVCTFNRLFKKFKGITPKEFRHHLTFKKDNP